MARLKFNLNEIESRADIEDGREKAKVKKVIKRKSKKGNPMLEWEWKLLTGSSKGSTVKSFTSLQSQALFDLKEHLEALGLKGKIDKSTDSLVGKAAVVMITHLPPQDGNGPGYPIVSAVMPKGTTLKVEGDEDDDIDDDEDFEDDDDEELEEDDEDLDEEDDDDDDDEDEDEEDDEDEDDDDEDEDDDDDEEEEEPAPKPKKKKSSSKKKKR